MLDLSFLRCTGLSLAYKGIIWYIGPFFWASLLVYAVLKCLDRGKALLLIAILTYFCYAVNINIYNGGLGREVRLEILSTGFLRVLGGLCIGVLLGAVKDAFGSGETHRVSGGRLRFWAISLVELLSMGLLMYNMLVERLFGNGFTTVILFAVLFLCLVSSGGMVTRLLSWRPLAYTGRWCYSIYVMQQVAFFAMARGYWKSHTELMQQYPGWSIGVSTLVAVLIGIATYYLVEAPIVKIYKYRKNRLRSVAEKGNAC